MKKQIMLLLHIMLRCRSEICYIATIVLQSLLIKCNLF